MFAPQAKRCGMETHMCDIKNLFTTSYAEGKRNNYKNAVKKLDQEIPLITEYIGYVREMSSWISSRTLEKKSWRACRRSRYWTRIRNFHRKTVDDCSSLSVGNQNELKVGDALLDYVTEMQQFCDVPAKAQEKAEQIYSELEGGIYQGRATEELTMYFASLSGHIGKLMSFYITGKTFIAESYKQLNLTDVHLTQWVEGYLKAPAGKGGS